MKALLLFFHLQGALSGNWESQDLFGDKRLLVFTAFKCFEKGFFSMTLKHNANLKVPIERALEGSCTLEVPAGSQTDPFHKLAFYNSKMSLNRTVSARALEAHFAGKPSGLVVDGLCATGARGIRYALEANAPKILFVDANPYAVRLLKRNIALNRLSKKAMVQCREFNSAMYDESLEPATWVEVDAFGSPAPFIQSALHATSDGGVLSLTATDFAKLAGARPSACIRHYDAAPIHCWAGHEIGIRIILGRVARTAALMDRAIAPIFSFYLQHAGKVMVKAADGASKADAMIQEMIGFIYICVNCMESRALKQLETNHESKCVNCGNIMQRAGPLWLGPMGEKDFLAKTLKAVRENPNASGDALSAQKLVTLAIEENLMPPIFIDVHELAGRLGVQVPSFASIEKKIVGQGYKFSRTHYAPTGIRTDAPLKFVSAALKNK